jgi:hypothetical protein
MPYVILLNIYYDFQIAHIIAKSHCLIYIDHKVVSKPFLTFHYFVEEALGSFGCSDDFIFGLEFLKIKSLKSMLFQSYEGTLGEGSNILFAYCSDYELLALAFSITLEVFV